MVCISFLLLLLLFDIAIINKYVQKSKSFKNILKKDSPLLGKGGEIGEHAEEEANLLVMQRGFAPLLT